MATAPDTCIIDSLAWLPFGWFNRALADALKARLTITPKQFVDFRPKKEPEDISRHLAESLAPAPQEPPEPIFTYTIDRARGRVGVPIHFGMEYLARCNKLHLVDFQCAEGYPFTARRFPDPYHAKVKEPEKQAQFMADVLRELPERRTMLAAASTGTGKTVVALNTAGRLGRSTLVIVPSKRLADQWREEAKLHLGLLPEEIGTVEDGKADYVGKTITIALVHNLKPGQWTDHFYRNFGFVVWDEAHRLGARSFSESMRQFPALYKLALTATPNRKDGCERLFLDYFGPPSITSAAKALPCDCYVVSYKRKRKKLPGNLPRPTLINCLAVDPDRNALIVNDIVIPLYERGRFVLVIGDRVGHLQALMALCAEAGIPEEHLGLFVSAYEEEVERPTCKSHRKMVRKVTFSAEHLNNVKANATIIFATYGMMKEGIDIPRLDAGVDVTPRSDGVQVIGRIRRPYPGKPRPVWFTIRDVGNAKMVRTCNFRLTDYSTADVTIIDR